MPSNPDGVLLLDKPPGFSSTQAMARAKRFLGSRKAGHTGTLDPFATGLLLVHFFRRSTLVEERTIERHRMHPDHP